MKIPKKLQIGGTVYKVVLEKDKENHRTYELGLCRSNYSLIVIDSGDQDQQNQDKTFIHESLHAIFQAMGENELNENEKFIDAFAEYLYQWTQQVEGKAS